MWSENFQMFKLDLEKAEEPEIKLPIIEKAREFQKNIYLCFIDYAKVFVWITKNCGKFFKMRIPDTWPAFWEICMQVNKQQLVLDMEQ